MNSNKNNLSLFVGTYINDTKHTMFVLEFNLKTKTLEKKQSINAGYNPSFISYNEECDVLYAVNELTQENDNSYGFVSCISKENNTYTIKKQLSTDGDAPCHILLSKYKKLLFVTNYGGSLLVYSLQKNGLLHEKIQTLHFSGRGIHTERQNESHPHATLESACGVYLYMTDLGRDRICIFKIDDDEKNPLTLFDEVHCPAGCGPRHMAWSDCQKYMYVSTELASSVLVYSHNMHTGKLTLLQECDIFADEHTPYPRTAPSEIAFFDGTVYVANRGNDSIALLHQNNDGTIRFSKNISCQGKNPRHFKISTIGTKTDSKTNDSANIQNAFLFVLNLDSHTITVFEIYDKDIHYCSTYSGIEKPAVMIDYV